jgi:hypothetical protein
VADFVKARAEIFGSPVQASSGGDASMIVMRWHSFARSRPYSINANRFAVFVDDLNRHAFTARFVYDPGGTLAKVFVAPLIEYKQSGKQLAARVSQHVLVTKGDAIERSILQ